MALTSVQTIKKLFPDANLRLPGKKIFGNLDPEFIQQRREGLDEFIHKLVSHPRLCEQTIGNTASKEVEGEEEGTEAECPDVRLFLALDNPRNAAQDVDPADQLDDPDTMENGTKEDANPVNLGPSEKPSVRPSDFEFLKVIGKGSFGKVMLARHKTEKGIYAVKVLGKAAIMKRNEAKHIMSERNVLLKNVKHPFLVGLHYSFQTVDKLYFVLDYVNGGEGHIVLTDFGLCKEGIEGMDTTSTFCGTPEYLAPEVLRKQPYDKTVDWWCLGAVLFEMVYGLPPFYSRDTAEMYDNILYKPLRLRTNISMAGRSILEGLLEKDKEKRLGAKRDFEENGQLDLKHFDPEFVREPVPASVGRSGGSSYRLVSASVMEADGVFEGFSYVPPSEDAFG
nr:hypothetical protein BaRGS_034984 [Batillaria attramentaria]